MQAMEMEAGPQAQQVLPPNPLVGLVLPGTRCHLALRVIQFVSAALAVAAMVSASDFYTVHGFILLVAAVSLQTVWSFLLALYDVAAMVTPLPDHWVVSKVIFGDVITGTLTFCAAFGSVGPFLYLHYDIETCAKEHCTKFLNATIRAFISFAAIIPTLIVKYIDY